MRLVSLITYWLLCFISLILATTSSAANIEEIQKSPVTLSINLKKIKSTTGTVIIELIKFQHKNTVDWNVNESINSENIKVREIKNEYSFLNISPGFYAIRAYQDINNNQLLDKASSGIPNEPVAFSNNPSLFKGEPKPTDCIIYIDKDTTIVLKFKHRKKRKKKR